MSGRHRRPNMFIASIVTVWFIGGLVCGAWLLLSFIITYWWLLLVAPVILIFAVGVFSSAEQQGAIPVQNTPTNSDIAQGKFF